MAREPRLFLPGVPLHIVDRGNARQACFFSDEDRLHYLKDLRDATCNHGAALHAYVLMTNHVHLLLTPSDPASVPDMIKRVAQSHAQYINWRYRRTGSVWEGRYKAAHVESETYLLVCQRYVDLNPVRAGMVQVAGEYRWSSYRSNAEGRANPLVTPHPLYTALGKDAASRQQYYRKLCEQPLTEKDVRRIREATNAGFGVGRQEFLKRIVESRR